MALILVKRPGPFTAGYKPKALSTQLCSASLSVVAVIF